MYGKTGRVASPCATCGVLSDGWFPDGSARWSPHEHGRPHYEDALVTIHHGDFRSRLIPDVALVIADPPFDIWTDVVDGVAALQCRSLVAFVNWQNRSALERLGRPRAELVWTFADGRWVSHNLPRLTHETILVYGETGDAYVGRPMSHVPPQRKGAGSVGRDRMPERTWVPRPRAQLDSTLAYPRDVASGTWSKPLPLLEQLIEWLCPVGGVVLDPFTGSGTALVAAKMLGRRAVGFDTSEEACDVAASRCSQEVLGLGA